MLFSIQSGPCVFVIVGFYSSYVGLTQSETILNGVVYLKNPTMDGTQNPNMFNQNWQLVFRILGKHSQHKLAL